MRGSKYENQFSTQPKASPDFLAEGSPHFFKQSAYRYQVYPQSIQAGSR